MIYHVFDVDGTITPTRSKIEDDFVERFIEFCKNNNVVIVSGSTKEMIEEQLPEEVLGLVKLYTCSGVEGCSIDIDYEINADDLISELEKYAVRNNFPHKTGNHVQIRKGMINFSIPGRNANIEQRKQFLQWNEKTKVMESIRNMLEEKFPAYEFRLGGETSIDITKKGINKSIVAKDIFTFDKDAFIIFYGNQILNGNDFPLAKFIDENNCGFSLQIPYPNIKKLI